MHLVHIRPVSARFGPKFCQNRAAALQEFEWPPFRNARSLANIASGEPPDLPPGHTRHSCAAPGSVALAFKSEADSTQKDALTQATPGIRREAPTAEFEPALCGRGALSARSHPTHMRAKGKFVSLTTPPCLVHGRGESELERGTQSRQALGARFSVCVA